MTNQPSMLPVTAPPLAAGDNLFLSHRNLPSFPTFIPTRPKTLTSIFTVRSSSSRSTDQILDALRPQSPFPPIKVAKRVVLVRHGQSTWNEEGRIQGSSNFSVLTPKGESQAETSREMLTNDSFDVCFSSPLARSKRTAEVIWGSRKEEIITDPDLREIDLYSFQGLLKHEGKEKYGAAFSQWQKDAPNFNIDGHYPVRELWSRARSCWNKILVHESRSVLVVAHNAVNQALVATAIGLGTEYFRYLLQSNCGVTVLDFIPRPKGGSPYICLNRLNQTPRSPVEESSGGRKAGKKLILVCHGSSMKDSEFQKTAELLHDLRLKAIVSSPTAASTEMANTIARVQEFADSLGADCVPHYVETKKIRELDVEDILRKSKKDSNTGPNLWYGWLNGLEIEVLTTLWEQSGRAWKSLLNELSDESGIENIVVAVAHPAIHIALLGHCLNLKMEMLQLFHLDAGSISVVDFPDGSVGRGVVRCINYGAHLGRWSVPITTDTGREDEF